MSCDLTPAQRNSSDRLLYRQEEDLNKTAILYPRLSLSPTGGIKESNGVFSGPINKIGEECSLLAEGLSALARVSGWSEYLEKMMDLLGEWLTSDVDLKFLFGGLARRAAEEIPGFAKQSSSIAPGENSNKSRVLDVQASTSRTILMVDRNHPGTVEYRGKIVTLTSKQFWLLAVLAESPGKCVPYNVIYEKVWGGEVVVEMQQISYHKAQLLRKFSMVAPIVEIKGLITAVSGEGLILVLSPSEVSLI